MISVVISTLDRPHLLSRCLDALTHGSRMPDEVVVVNQGATGPVEEVVERARSAGLVVVHLAQPRRGLSASQNLGVTTAASPIVAIVDDDCVPDDRWVQVIDETFSSDNAPDLIGGRILPRPAEGDRVVAVSSRTSEIRVDHGWPVLPWAIGSGGSFAVRRDRYLEAGGNDERLGTGSPGRAGNDLDLFYRITRAGGRARYEPALVVRHERATLAEHRSRRSGYGYGVGACVGRWVRDGDRNAWRVLLAWVRLRLAGMRRRRTAAAVADEARILAGTARGLRYGLRLRESWPARPT